MRYLKEWDVVGRALEDGRQILLARKGGILDGDDDNGLFVPVFDEFFLFPTRLHQSEQVREALKRSEFMRYEDLLKEAPETSEKIPLRLFARVAETHAVTDRDALKRLDAEHIWKEGFLEKRFEWGSVKGLTILVVRAYLLDPPVTIASKPAFAGCRSWIEDDEEISVASLKPVLSEEDFSKKRLRVRRALSGE
ncbi:MAG TPA: DUF1802 family protein [bacterium]|nr:DUF1802 family protein [bacterium]